MKRLPLAFFACFAIAACQQSDSAVSSPQSSATTANAAAPVGATESVSAKADTKTAASEAHKVDVENDFYSFQFSYPAAAGAIPELKAWFDDKAATQQRDLEKLSREMREAAKQEGFPYRAYGEWSDWKVVTELPDWLSLSATVGTYTGGAHPNHNFDALLWDKRAKMRRQPADLFLSKQALANAVQTDFCRILDRERQKKRGDAVDYSGFDDSFNGCIDPFEGQLILGSSTGETFNRIGFLVPPYAAGPYAEGDYEVTLPVTKEIVSAVKPEYRQFFTVIR